MTRKLVSLVLALALACLCIPALGEGELSVTDMTGREVKLAGATKSVVVLMPSDCEILFAIGAGAQVIGRGSYCDYPAEAVADIPVVKSGMELNVEEIVALQPDAVILTKMSHSQDQVELLENAGLPVIVTDAQTVADTFDCIALLGKVTGNEEEAAAVVQNMKDRLDAVAAKASDAGLTVYFEATPLEFGWGLYSAGKGSFMDEIGALCGLKNIFGDVTEGGGWPVVSEEDVIAADPDLIVTIDSNGMGDQNAADIVLTRESWKDMSAVKNGRVYVVDGNAFSRPGPRLADAAEQLLEIVESLTAEAPAA